MKNQHQKIYGKPTGEGAFFPEIYCAVCNRIPLIDTWNRSTGEIIGAEITPLSPLPVQKLGPAGPEMVTMMVCEGCLSRIKEGVKETIRRSGGMRKMIKDILHPGDDEDLPGPEGGVTVSKK